MTRVHAAHDPTALFQSPTLRVELCSCGTFHVHVGDLTLRLTAEAFTHLSHGLGVAQERAERRAALQIWLGTEVPLAK